MTRSRADEILKEWKMVANSVPMPMEAPRRHSQRTMLPFGMVGTTAIAAIVIVGLVIRGGGPGPNTPAAGAGDGPTRPSPTAMASPSSSPTEAPSPSPTVAAQEPSAADVVAAGEFVDRYTADLVRADFAAAWALLGPADQSRWGSLANFRYDRSAYFNSVAGKYSVKTQPPDIGPITKWLSGTNGASIDLHHAVLVEVDYPALAASNGYDVYIVNAGPNGLEIYGVR